MQGPSRSTRGLAEEETTLLIPRVEKRIFFSIFFGVNDVFPQPGSKKKRSLMKSHFLEASF